MLYKSQFRKIDPYDWFCGPGSYMSFELLIIWIMVEKNYMNYDFWEKNFGK